ncbi:hypothetical protein FDI24_gp160 [Acidovorax phage ACP17]|uniref:Uncharacterized protein n=1 Tax=Acidovorax phage ACP17 TaxID=2010329 RepID=A0A218M321_9CAUD|nr:hypothetical protein FDI24_gp160 [Acidovorax phage ACP17]ASD50442.1 hypothetical protein [Acidovorax phage ACP17]
MSIIGLLGVLFVALKLIGVITWSWWLVLLPFYLGFAIFIGFLVLTMGFAATFLVIGSFFKGWR